MPDFATFDRRGYATVDARRGYGEWAASYEDVVEDALDLAVLERLEVDWAAAATIADLGCGTGRTAAWLRGRTTADIDGVDLTPEMLDHAAARGLFRRLVVADVADTGLPSASYDVVTTCLVDEHLAALGPLYEEALRLVRPGGAHVIVGFHPFFIMSSGMPTHYDRAPGEPVAIETHVHLPSEHVHAALGAGWRLAQMEERLVDEAWIARKPRWAAQRGYPVSFGFVWRHEA